MKEELYIDNKPVDLGSGTNVTLSYKSNFLSDVSKIVSNNSYTINLPLTARNKRVIEGAHIPSCSTRFPRINHAGRYVRNGVELISKGNVSLLEINDGIDIALSWGNVTKFASIVNDNKTLRDLSYDETSYISWIRPSSGAFFPPMYFIDYGFKDTDETIWYHPCMSVKSILQRIQEDCGVTFNIHSRSDMLDRLIIPLTTRYDSDIVSEGSAEELVFANRSYRFDSPIGYFVLFESREIDNFYYAAHYLTNEVSGTFISGIRNKFKNTKYRVSGQMKFKVSGEYENLSLTGYLMRRYGDDDMFTLFSASGTIQGDYYVIEIDSETDVLDCTGSNHLMYFYLTGIASSATTVTDISGSITIQAVAFPTPAPASGDDTINNRYYYIPNLPDIKQIDFIKGVMSMLGLFAIPGDNNQIEFYPIEYILENKSRKYDWSKYLVSTYMDNRPISMSFSYSEFAQNNVYAYDEDDYGKYSGIIKVNDETLDLEKEAITLPFIPTETNGDKAYIPLYTYDDEGNLQYDEDDDARILLLPSVNSTKPTFIGLSWPELIDKNYKGYKSIVAEQKVINVSIRIREVDLKDLDMSIPVYLSQYGKYYAIVSIQVGENGICKCELFQLED